MPGSAALTNRQEQVLGFVASRQRETGLVPTLQEIANHFGLKSPNSVRQHLRLIEQKGFVHRIPGRSRGLMLPRQGDHDKTGSVSVPLMGSIPAGSPQLAQENAEDHLTLPAHLFHGNALFALRVEGHSMIGAGILNGDIAVLDAKHDVTNGSIAAVLIEDEATLKRVYRTRSGLSLKADNPIFREIKLSRRDAQRVRILGLLVGIVRTV